MTNMSFGDWLKQQRTLRRMKQTDLEELAGLANKYVSKVETGILRVPTDNVRARIHKALGTSDDDLVVAGVFTKLEHEGDVIYLPVESQKGLGLFTVRLQTEVTPEYVLEQLAGYVNAIRWNQGMLEGILAQFAMMREAQQGALQVPKASWEEE